MIDYAAARTAMVDRQVRPSDVTSYPIIEAMLDVPRERFVPAALRPVAYAGEHLTLAPGRVMLDPRAFAKMLDVLDPGPDDVALDLACGPGYSTAVLARLTAWTTGVEPDAAMARAAAATLSELEVDTAEVVEGAAAEGAADGAPYDVMLINGGVETLPRALTDQLAEGGRVALIRMDGALGRCQVITKTEGVLTARAAFDASAPVLEGFAKAPVFEF
ncbi:MAG: methyltransferase domain-containing protein [Pseudomonadota bacterium]